MATRIEIITSFYDEIEEDRRLIKSRHGQLEFLSTMHYIHKYAKKGDRIIEIGAGTGRYSIALAKEVFDVAAVELVESNLNVLRQNSLGIDSIKSYQGDATNLSRFEDNSFDVTLSLGPLYHLYDKDEIQKAIDEAIRITKPNGIIMLAFISIYEIMDANYLYGNWATGIKEYYDDNLEVIHNKEQVFTGYNIVEFEKLINLNDIDYITTAGLDGNLESLEERNDFSFSDEEFKSYISWHLKHAEQREYLGRNNHLLYIFRKK